VQLDTNISATQGSFRLRGDGQAVAERLDIDTTLEGATDA
jgi:hypothetical protein